jgi:hypothetical protein
MSAAHSHKQRRFPSSDKSDPVMNDNGSKSKFGHGLLGNLPQLMFRHFPVRFIIDSLDFSPILETANDSPKLDSRARSAIHLILLRIEPRFCH